jgi:hypothetical protein
MGNDVTWWKDRDQWMPGPDHEPTRVDSDPAEQDGDEDVREVANDASDEFDVSELPDRGPDH